MVAEAGFEEGLKNYYVTWAQLPASGFGETSVISSNGNLRKFNFAADGSNERQKLVDLYQYFADELAAGRKVNALMGAGDYGIDARGITQLFSSGSLGLNFSGMGRSITRLGFVDSTQVSADWRVMEFSPDVIPVLSITSITQSAGVATLTATAHGAVIGDTVRVYEKRLRGAHNAATSATVLTDTSKTNTADNPLAVNEVVGMLLTNVTDGSTGVITANSAAGGGGTTFTVAALTGGTDNDFDSGDFYTIETTTPEYYGLQLVTGTPTANTLTYSVPTATTTPATGELTVAVHSKFLRDFRFANFGFFDDDPEAHANVGTEETHGVALKYGYNSEFIDLSATNIGDEAVELEYNEQFQVRGFRSFGTPNQETSGGGGVSIKSGSHHGLITDFIIQNADSPSSSTYGLNFKNVSAPEYTSHIKASNGHIIKPKTAGVYMNTSASDIEHIEMDNITVIGGPQAFSEGGSTHLLSGIKATKFFAFEQTGLTININRSLNDANDMTFKDSTFDGLHHSNDNSLVFANGSNLKFLDNDYRNAARAVYATQALNVLVRGGVADSCGGVGSSFPVVYDATPSATRNMIVDNLKVINAETTSQVFRSVDQVINCPEIQSLVNPSGGVATLFKNFSNNKKVSAKLLPVTIANAVVDGNSFDPLDQPTSTGLITVSADGATVNNNISTQTNNTICKINSADGCIVTHNNMPNHSLNNAVEETGTSDNNIVKDNQLNGGSVVLLGLQSRIKSVTSGEVPAMTTTERDTLSPNNGMVIYNTTTTVFNFYENGAWVTK